MDWSLVESTLETWVGTITGLPIYWEKRPRSMRFSNVGYALLSITGRATVGNDTIVREYDSAQDNEEEIRTYQLGQRQFTLQIQITTHRQRVDVDARHYTSLIRDAVHLPLATGAALDAADIAIAFIAAEVDIDFELDDREMSVAQIDLRINGSAITEDTKSQWIETVKDADAEVPESTVVWTGDLEVG